MIIYNCDVCAKEISGRENAVSNRILYTKDLVKIEVTVGYEGTWNKGELCQECVLEVVIEAVRGQVVLGKPDCTIPETLDLPFYRDGSDIAERPVTVRVTDHVAPTQVDVGAIDKDLAPHEPAAELEDTLDPAAAYKAPQ